MTTADAVDWTAVDRRGRRQAWAAVPVLPLFLAAVVADNDLLDGVGWGVGLPVLAVVTLGLLAVTARQQAPVRRARADEAVRVQYALLHQVDPGPALRERVDRQAGHFAEIRWLGVAYPLLAVTFLDPGEWARSTWALLADVLLAGAFLALSWWWLRQTRAARRWLADPPGGSRARPAPAGWERYLGRRWLGIAAVGCLVLGVVFGPLAVFLG